MINNKSDSVLGFEVREHLLNMGLENPVLNINRDNISLKKLTKHYKKIHDIIGLDLDNDSISDTPKQISQNIII